MSCESSTPSLARNSSENDFVSFLKLKRDFFTFVFTFFTFFPVFFKSKLSVSCYDGTVIYWCHVADCHLDLNHLDNSAHRHYLLRLQSVLLRIHQQTKIIMINEEK